MIKSLVQFKRISSILLTKQTLADGGERENTVSCILSGLMGDESDEMWTELNSSTAETGWTVGEEEPGYFEDMNWEPTPIDAAPGISLLPFFF